MDIRISELKLTVLSKDYLFLQDIHYIDVLKCTIFYTIFCLIMNLIFFEKLC